MEIEGKFPESKQGYEWLEILGIGTVSRVSRVEVKEGFHIGEIYAVKVVKLDKVSDLKLESIMKYIVSVCDFKHQSLLTYPFTFFDDKNLYLGMQYMKGGSLSQILGEKFPEGIKDKTLLVSLLKPVLDAIHYLHSNLHIHRDVKASNVLISSGGDIKLADHGLSAKFKKGKKRESLVGSPCWLAPEMLNSGKNGYDFKVDIWAFGITAIELVQGKPPHYNETGMATILKIIEDEPPRLPNGSYGKVFKELVNSCLQKDPDMRPTVEELLVKYKSLWGKARSGKYLDEKLGPFNQVVVEKSGNEMEEEVEINHPTKAKIIWDFGLGEDEDSFIPSDSLTKIGI